jgi:methionyl-tRNA synthetase
MEQKTPTPEATPSPIPAPAQAAVAAPVVDDSIDIDHFMKVKFRVARVESAEPVPKSNKLLKLQVDLGALGKRQILSGISKFYTPESLVGKKIIVVANLKPAKLMGLESQGMLLAASSDDGSLLVIADPGQNMPEGSVVR